MFRRDLPASTLAQRELEGQARQLFANYQAPRLGQSPQRLRRIGMGDEDAASTPREDDITIEAQRPQAAVQCRSAQSLDGLAGADDMPQATAGHQVFVDGCRFENQAMGHAFNSMLGRLGTVSESHRQLGMPASIPRRQRARY